MKKSRYSEEHVVNTLPPARGRDQRWSMDFVHDALVNGRALRVLTVIDQWSRESVFMEVKAGLIGQCVAEALEAVSTHRPLPKMITVDHGTEFTSTALDAWTYRRGATLDFIRPGKPVENAFIESFYGRLRDECLNLNSLVSVPQAQDVIERWRRDYNDRRPHGALGLLRPSEYANQRQQQGTEVTSL